MKKTWVSIPDVLFFQEGPGVRNTQYTASGIKLLNVANLVDGKIDLSTSDRYISEEEAYGRYRHFLCDEGDFIVASSGIKVEYIDKKMGFVEKSMLPLCMNTSTIRFKVLNQNQLRIRYFMYYLKSNHFKKQLGRQITGSAQLNYGPSHLKKMVVPLVDISAQDEIVSKMDAIQHIIDLRNSQLMHLDDLIKARFVELFGDPIVNSCKLPVVTLGEISGLITKGASPSWQGFSYINDKSQTLFVTSENVREGYLDLSSPKYVEDGFNVKQKRSVIHKGDFLINIVGASIGRAAQFNLDCKANMNQASALVRIKDRRINGKYLLTYLNSDKAQRMYDSMKSDTGRANLSLQDISNLSILLPPIKKQIEFDQFVSQVDKSKAAVQKSLDEAQLLFDSLMQQYFE